MKEPDKSHARSSDEASQQTIFRECYPLVLSIVEEIQPLLEINVDQREVLAMASMMLGKLVRKGRRLNRRDLRKAIEQHLVETYATDNETKRFFTEALPPQSQSENTAGSRILVVDDSEMARRQIRFFLKKDGYEVYEAKSGEEALWLVNEVDPDLILMDVSMDGMDGMETCQKLKEDQENSTLPVIFLSAKGERDEIVSGFRAGAIDYIVKPFHPTESLTRIRTHLRVKKLVEMREKNILELKHLNKTKDRILRVASHDLRNPLAAIAGLADFLKEDCEGFSAAQREIVESIDEASKSVVLLLNELLDFSTFESGKQELNMETLDLCRLVTNLVPLFRGEAERKNIGLSVDCTSELAPVRADRHQMRRVVDNLLSNALKFTPSGGRVTVRVIRESDEAICLQFDDTGPGIAATEVDRLFVEFGTTSNKPTGGERSTGLGLSICQRIVHAHEGIINFENLPEGGARFSVILPVLNV